MKKIFLGITTLTIGLALLALMAISYKIYTTPAPINQISEIKFQQHEGTQSADLDPLIKHFEGQIHLSYCGVASSVIIANALGLNLTQNSFFDSSFDEISTFYNGMALQQLAGYLSQHNLSAEVSFANDFSGAIEFRETLIKNLQTGGDFVLINYYRKTLEQIGAGHISPVADYNPETDSFLILDVADYKYGPTWVKAKSLYNAINTSVSSSGLKRGIVQVSL